ncbi:MULTISPECIES: hypothetical protein [unclassified Streptomyces]|uniref:hypothetical protein n=1 Tax=unclassified Streptomyces TaxID=2593676 RepID=UPI0029A5D92F|nr:hypothetical protein [Streptomyces sp. FL07-04A]MDX3577174.1 hypothetical protein [Streptomyces sp. FL07-04A]
MIKQVSHTVTGCGAADLGLALDVACELHAPAAATRPPELAPQLTGLRAPAGRPHVRKVPLKRLAAMRG